MIEIGLTCHLGVWMRFYLSGFLGFGVGDFESRGIISFCKTLVESGIDTDNHLGHPKNERWFKFSSRKTLVFCTAFFLTKALLPCEKAHENIIKDVYYLITLNLIYRYSTKYIIILFLMGHYVITFFHLRHYIH